VTKLSSVAKSTDLAVAAGVDLALLREIQLELSKWPSQRVLKIWFGTDNALDDELSGTFEKLRKVLRKQSDLFRWVYGDDNPHSLDALHVKLPSVEKKLLVELLLADCRGRYPWMTPRLIHAFAFNPDSFTHRTRKNNQDFQMRDWGPLYKRVTIPKGSGNQSRYLWIPNPPLKRLQKSMLRILGPAFASTLHPNVFGVRSGEKAPAFRNALHHAHSSHVVSFDIRDFFPSTTINEILSGIRWSKRSSSPMVAAQHLPNHFITSTQKRNLNWSHDAEILIARLGTYRGRLPQGSPLSPMLANIAFSPYDARLMGLLAARFGKRGFHYTRYFDDISISLVGSTTTRGYDKRDLQMECTSILLKGFEGSPYKLNNRKTRSSTLDGSNNCKSGHKVTGLLVRSGDVSLPRKLKRCLRVILYNLETFGFVESAKIWSKNKGHGTPIFRSLTKGHVWQDNIAKNRRISAERMTWLMLRQFYPDLKIQRLMPDWHGWQEMYDPSSTFSKGKDVSTIVERILAAAWEGSISITSTPDTTNELHVSQANVPIARLIAESDLEFFLLDKRTAIGLVEFWHYLNGLFCYLNACPKEPEFAQITAITNSVKEALTKLEIKPKTLSLSTGDPKQQKLPEDTAARISKQLTMVIDRYRDYAGNIGSRIPRKTTLALREQFIKVVESEEDLHDWLAILHMLFQKLRLLPSQPKRNRKWAPADLYSYLRVKYEKCQSLTYGRYKVEEKFENDGPHLSRSQSQQFQHKILHYLHHLFDDTTNSLAAIGFERWKQELIPNEEFGELQTCMEQRAEKMLDCIDKLSEGTNQPNFLLSQASDRFSDANKVKLVKERDFEMSSGAAWDDLTKASNEVFKSVKDSIASNVFDRLPEDVIKKSKPTHSNGNTEAATNQNSKNKPANLSVFCLTDQLIALTSRVTPPSFESAS
jgi:hypothetical protein